MASDFEGLWLTAHTSGERWTSLAVSTNVDSCRLRRARGSHVLPRACAAYRFIDLGSFTLTRHNGIGSTIDFNLFTDRTVRATGNNGVFTGGVVWSVLTRVDVAIALPV